MINKKRPIEYLLPKRLVSLTSMFSCLLANSSFFVFHFHFSSFLSKLVIGSSNSFMTINSWFGPKGPSIEVGQPIPLRCRTSWHSIGLHGKSNGWHLKLSRKGRLTVLLDNQIAKGSKVV